MAGWQRIQAKSALLPTYRLEQLAHPYLLLSCWHAWLPGVMPLALMVTSTCLQLSSLSLVFGSHAGVKPC